MYKDQYYKECSQNFIGGGRMRALHLPYGGQMITLCSALREAGVEATSCHFHRSNFNFKADICLDLQHVPDKKHESLKRELLNQVIDQYDIFHFHFGMTFFDDHSDLEYLKQRGKKVIVQHRGSDVRRLSIARSYGNPYVLVKYPDEHKLVSELETLSAYIDHAIVADHELYPYVQNFYKHVHLIRQAIDLRKFEPSYPSADIKAPLIVHAPSHPKIKGTDYIKQAIDQLVKKKYPLQFQIVQRVPHPEAIQIYKQADLIVDQLRIGSFGILSLEGMALGKPVVCYIREGLMDLYPEDLPIVNANPGNIYETLKSLIRNPKQLRELGLIGRRYVEDHHDSLKIAKQLAELYRQL
jgi:glycosyltransferase involved in cell wall biosynthesis